MSESGLPALSIIIPALNEAAALRTLLPELRASFPDAEIIVVDDGSTDDTSQVCSTELCKLVQNPYRLGNGAAVKRGARAATGELLAFLDGDGQHTPEHLIKLLEKFHSGDFDMVVGARSASSQASPARGLGNFFLERLASWMTGQSIPDLTSGWDLNGTATTKIVTDNTVDAYGMTTNSTTVVEDLQAGMKHRTTTVNDYEFPSNYSCYAIIPHHFF